MTKEKGPQPLWITGLESGFLPCLHLLETWMVPFSACGLHSYFSRSTWVWGMSWKLKVQPQHCGVISETTRSRGGSDKVLLLQQRACDNGSTQIVLAPCCSLYLPSRVSVPLQLLHASLGLSAGTLRSELGQTELSCLVGVTPSPLCS